MNKQGLRFVVEGLDGTGKSTVVKMILWQFAQNGFETIQVDEPGGPTDSNGKQLLPVAQHLRDLVKDGSYDSNPTADLGMFNVSRFASYKLVSKPHIAKGGIVGQARDYDSSVVYQGFASKLGVSYVEETCRQFMDDESYFQPDFKTILLLEDEQTRQERISQRGALEKPDKFESRDNDFQETLKAGYHSIATTKHIDTTSILPNQTKEEIAEIVLNKLLKKTGFQITQYDWGLFKPN